MVKAAPGRGWLHPSLVTMAEDGEGAKGPPSGMELEDVVTSTMGDAFWETLEIVRGSIIEIDLAATNEAFPVGSKGLFVVMQVSVTVDRTVIAEVRSLGTGNPEVDGAFSSRFNRKRGRLHFCVSRPCTHGDVSDVLHVTKVKLWSCRWEECPELTAIQKRAIKKFLGGAAPGEDPEEEPPAGEPLAEGPKGEPSKRRPALRGRGVPKRTPLKRPSGSRKVEAAVPAEGREPAKSRRSKKSREDGIPEESRERLKKSLADLKERVTGIRGPAVADLVGPVEESSGDSVVPVDSPSEPGELMSGASLKRLESRVKKPRKEKEKVKDKRRSDGPSKKSAAMKALEDTSVGSLRGPQSQLVRQALVVSHNEKKERKSRPEKASMELAQILTKTLKGKDRRKKKDKDKKKKKGKKRRRSGKDSDPSSSDGETSDSSLSCPSSARGSWDKSSDSEDELEAPLRKKAKAHPGSILTMLVEHAKEQLDQSSMVGIPEEGGSKVTQGVKLTSYFQILLKAKLAGAMPQQREMHHLSICMDLLRQGRLSAVGDALAARFRSLHQSVLDGNWVAARHMELYPLEESSAAGASIILKTRKHARLAAKAQGYDPGNFGKSYGRGRGGKGKYDYWNQDGADQKGKKGKNAKGKGKGSNKGGWWKDNPSKGDEWKERQETKPDQ